MCIDSEIFDVRFMTNLRIILKWFLAGSGNESVYHM
jgi:hypothetical protein